MYFMRPAGVGVGWLEEISDDDKVDEILDDIANEDKKMVDPTVIRATGPRPTYINKGYLSEQQLPLRSCLFRLMLQLL